MSIFRASKTWIYFGRLDLEELFMPMDLLAVPLTTVFAEDVSIQGSGSKDLASASMICVELTVLGKPKIPRFL